MSLLRCASLLALAACALAARAGVYTFSGTIDANDPTFALPDGAGATAPYDQYLFSVTRSGTYSFITPFVASLDPDTFLYLGSMDPAAPLSNLLIGNDNAPLQYLGSAFLYDLTAGTTYGYVISGARGTEGSYQATVSGPGSILPGAASAVPGPTAALSFAFVALRRRKRA